MAWVSKKKELLKQNIAKKALESKENIALTCKTHAYWLGETTWATLGLLWVWRGGVLSGSIWGKEEEKEFSQQLENITEIVLTKRWDE